MLILGMTLLSTSVKLKNLVGRVSLVLFLESEGLVLPQPSRV